MNPLDHSKISVKRRGGIIEDYYPIHFFLDSTKELCSDNRHLLKCILMDLIRCCKPFWFFLLCFIQSLCKF